MKPRNGAFLNTMNRGERYMGVSYLFIHIILLPVLLGLYVYASGSEDMTEFLMEAAHYAAGVVFLIFAMKDYLRISFDIFLDNKLRSLLVLTMAVFLFFLLMYLVTAALLLTIGDAIYQDTDYIVDMTRRNFGLMLAMNSLVMPFVEEVLFRGVLFGVLRQRNRVLAYSVSVIAFSLSYIWTDLIFNFSPMTLVLALQYVPEGAAAAWCYENSGNIWTPICFRALVNTATLILLIS